MFDELKEKTMKKLDFKNDDEYFGNLEIYVDNLLAPEEMLLNIHEYIRTRNPEVLEMDSEMRIARDMFGGYDNGN